MCSHKIVNLVVRGSKVQPIFLLKIKVEIIEASEKIVKWDAREIYLLLNMKNARAKGLPITSSNQ